MNELISLLTRERLLIERMLYRVANMRNLLVGGQARFLAWASDEVSDAADRLRDAELNRATCYQVLVDTRGFPETFTWEGVLERATDTEAALLRGLRSDIGALNAELKGHLAACRELGEAGLASATEVLAQLQGVDVTAAQTARPSIDPRRHLDRTL